MTIVVLGDHPEFAALIDPRRQTGVDGHDEVWKGVYYISPYAHARHGRIQQRLARVLGPYADVAGYEVVGSFNLGEPDDYRVPDLALRDSDSDSDSDSDDVYVPSADLVLEVLSPGDESFTRFDFYARREVDEILIADPDGCTIRLWSRRGASYLEVNTSAGLKATAAELTSLVNWS